MVIASFRSGSHARPRGRRFFAPFALALLAGAIIALAPAALSATDRASAQSSVETFNHLLEALERGDACHRTSEVQHLRGLVRRAAIAESRLRQIYPDLDFDRGLGETDYVCTSKRSVYRDPRGIRRLIAARVHDMEAQARSAPP